MFGFLTFSVIVLVLGAWAKYDEDLARYKAWPLSAAAYNDDVRPCVNQIFTNSTFIRMVTVPCDQVKQDTCSGFTVVSYTDQAIVLTFRGSEDTTQIVEEVIEEIFDNKTKFVGGGTVALYFYQGFLDIWNGGMKDDFLSLKNKHPGYELWVTGHSLGASIASLCAGYIAKMGYFPGNKIKLVTFGQPRTGDLAYATYIDNTISYAYRVVHKDDLVPHLPPIWLEMGDFKNYTHHKSEIWYNNGMAVGSPYVECNSNESDKCSDQLEKNLFDLSWGDHDYYFNISDDQASAACNNYFLRV